MVRINIPKGNSMVWINILNIPEGNSISSPSIYASSNEHPGKKKKKKSTYILHLLTFQHSHTLQNKRFANHLFVFTLTKKKKKKALQNICSKKKTCTLNCVHVNLLENKQNKKPAKV